MMTSHLHDAFNGCNRLVYCDSAALYRQQLAYEQQQLHQQQRDRFAELQKRRDAGNRSCRRGPHAVADVVMTSPLNARSTDVTECDSAMTRQQFFPIQRHPFDWSAAAAMMQCNRLRHQMRSTVTHHQCPTPEDATVTPSTPTSTPNITPVSLVEGSRSHDHGPSRWIPTSAGTAPGNQYPVPFGGISTRSDTSRCFYPSSIFGSDVVDDGNSTRRTRSTSGDSSSDVSNASVNGAARNEGQFSENSQHGDYHWMHVIGEELI